MKGFVVEAVILVLIVLVLGLFLQNKYEKDRAINCKEVCELGVPK